MKYSSEDRRQKATMADITNTVSWFYIQNVFHTHCANDPFQNTIPSRENCVNLFQLASILMKPADLDLQFSLEAS